MDKLRNTNESLLDKSDKHDKSLLRINNELLKFNDVDKLIRENQGKIEDTVKNMGEYQYYSNKKFSEIDTSMTNVIEMINELNKNLDKKGSSSNVQMSNLLNSGQTMQEGSSGQMANEIGKTNKEVDNLKKLLRDFNEKLDKLSKLSISFEEQIKELRAEKAFIQANARTSNLSGEEGISIPNDAKKKLDNTYFNDEDSNNKFNNNLTELRNENEASKQEIEMLFDRTNKLQEALKNLMSSLNHKLDKGDFEKLTKGQMQENEKLHKNINDINKNLEIKIKNFLQNGGLNLAVDMRFASDAQSDNKDRPKANSPDTRKRGNGGNSNNNSYSQHAEFDEEFINMTREIVEKELQSKEVLVKLNEILDEQNNKTENNKQEIDKIFESIVEIRRALADCPSDLDIKILEINEKVSEVELNLRKQRLNFEERFKSLEMDNIETEENNENTNPSEAPSGGSLKDNVKFLNNNIKIITDKIDKLTLRQDNMNNDILTRVKKDLSAESGKILSEFKSDLKNSINKIEEQLREKVDKFSLDEFGKNVNDKLSNEMNKKLDRSDLRKNNNLINKKIDTLENKISKTLVDTLIDLQMEEAPLIVKKPIAGNGSEKCASCNQIILNNSNYDEYHNNTALGNNYFTNNNNFHHNNPMPQKFKLKSVHDNCYKFGAGSYSRYLGSIDNVNEDLKFKSFQLPDINTNKNSRKINNSTSLNDLKNREFSEKNFNSIINEELEKKMINPENLIKTANKVYENVEKEKRSLVNK